MPSLTERLRADPPAIHGAGDEYWGLSWPALEWLERSVESEMQTLEVGAGSSTIVFAGAGSSHEAVTPDSGEEERVRAACARLGVPSGSVTFHIGPSHEVLPRLPARELDLVLVDGAHGFPYPILDWWAVSARVRVGGLLLLDDAYMPPVAAVVDAARRDSAWDFVGAVGYRTAVFKKVASALPPFDWDGGRVGGRMSFRYLPAPTRMVASARHRFFTTRAGLALVGLRRRGSHIHWRKQG